MTNVRATESGAPTIDQWQLIQIFNMVNNKVTMFSPSIINVLVALMIP